jgi:hypothetical protein
MLMYVRVQKSVDLFKKKGTKITALMMPRRALEGPWAVTTSQLSFEDQNTSNLLEKSAKRWSYWHQCD